MLGSEFFSTYQAGLQGYYEPSLVALSFLVAALAAYIAFELATQLRRTDDPAQKHFWHGGAALVMAAGIWCMHFTGMLAFNLGIEHHYDWRAALMTLLVPVLGCVFVFRVTMDARTRPAAWTIPLAASVMTAALAAAHVLGMRAMVMDAALIYRPLWFALSCALAFVLSCAALWFVFYYAAARVRMPLLPRRLPNRLCGALCMAGAMCAMYYVAMAGTDIVPGPDARLGIIYNEKKTLLVHSIGFLALLVFAIAGAALRINETLSGQLRAQVGKRTRDLEAANADLRRARDEAESASMAKTEFLANMSHELRTPMNVVVGIAQLLRDDTLTPSRRAEFLGMLQDSAETLLRLLNELLDVSKIEADKIQLETLPFDLGDMVREVAALMTVRTQQKGLFLSLDYQVSCGDIYWGDSLRLRQILVNLISNAAKFTEEGGVTVTVRCDQPQTGRGNGRPHWVTIEVSDTGIGIPPDKLDAIFEKFVQVDATTTRRYGGTGLGLAICKALIEKMGGTITVSSVLDAGSLFTIRLPLVQSDAAALARAQAMGDALFTNLSADATPSAEARLITAKRPVVLVVDDSAANATVTAHYLEHLGYDTVMAVNGREVLERYEERPFDAILMDIEMPEIDGFDVTREIRRREAEQNRPHTPIIALTAYATPQDRDNSMAAGMDDYVAKPCRMDDLRIRLSTLIGGTSVN